MKISVTRTGGFAGLTESLGSVDTSTLDPDQAREAGQLVEEARFFDLPSRPLDAPVGADMFHYEVSVSDRNRTHTVGFIDDGGATTTPMHRLIDFVMRSG